MSNGIKITENETLLVLHNSFDLTHNISTNLSRITRDTEGARGPFLERPGSFTGPKSNIQIEI